MNKDDLNENNESFIEKVVKFPIDTVFSLANTITNIFSEKPKNIYDSPSLSFDDKYKIHFLTENNLEPNKNKHKIQPTIFQKPFSQEKKKNNKIPLETFEEIQYKNIKNQYDFYIEQKKFINNLQKNYVIKNYENISEEDILKAKNYIDHANENIYSRNKLLNETKPYYLSFDVKKILSIINNEENNNIDKIKNTKNDILINKPLNIGRKYSEIQPKFYEKDNFHKKIMKYDSFDDSLFNSIKRDLRKEYFLMQENNARYESIIIRKEKENAEMKRILQDYEKIKKEEMDIKDLKINN